MVWNLSPILISIKFLFIYITFAYIYFIIRNRNLEYLLTKKRKKQIFIKSFKYLRLHFFDQVFLLYNNHLNKNKLIKNISMYPFIYE